jgi:hypothetical protein
VKYAILIYNNPESRRVWQSSPEAQRAEGIEAYATLNDELAERGELIVSEALADPSHTTHVTIRDGRTLTGDGPFAEVKEMLAGFYLVECDTIERAVEIAAQVPELEAGRIEVRPVMTYSGLD